VSGQKGIYANLLIDGGDYNSTWQCGVRSRSSSAPSFGFEALQEIQVVRNTFSSEFGRSTGGLITLSTRSGTNAVRGSSFYLGRDGGLASKDAFGRQPVATVHQFGGSVGGPIALGRTFFFTAAEFQEGSKGVDVVYANLDRSAAAARTLLGIAPEERLDAVSDGQSVINRIDHRVSDTNTLLGRFDFTRTYAANSPGATALQTGLGIAATTTSARSNLLLQPASNYTTLGQWTSVLSNRHVNELRVQFSREIRPRTYQGEGPQVTVGNIGIYGPPSSGSWGNVGFASEDNRYQLVDNFSIVSGAHTTKLGADFLRMAGHALYNQQFNGAYSFSSLANWESRTPTSYVQFTGTGEVNLAINQLAFYVQDDWRVAPGLTLTPGLRYDAQWNPDYAPATEAQNRFPAATSIPDDTRMIAPRLGLAWDVNRDAKTIVRAGSGLFYAPTYMSIFAQSILFNGGNPEKAFAVSVTDPTALRNAFRTIGVDLASAPLGNLPTFTPAQMYQLFGTPGSTNNLAPFYFDPKFRNPRATQFQLGLERQVATGVAANVTYSQIATAQVARQRDVNIGDFWVDATGRRHYNSPSAPTSAATVRPLGPKFSKVQVTEAAGRSLYRGFTTAVNVRRVRYTVDLYYTRSWNYSYDDIERGFTGIAYSDVNDIASEYNYSNIDEPHVFIGNVNYSLPLGLDVASSMKFASGRPFTARAGTTDLNQDGQTNDRPIVNGEMFKRNSFRNAGFKDVTLRVQKNFILPRGTVSVSMEAFNLFNFANVTLGASQMVYGAGSTPVPATFMQYKDAAGKYIANNGNTAGDPRTLQFGLRFGF
jgi:outer membrane receptor protein involved in Fe transport